MGELNHDAGFSLNSSIKIYSHPWENSTSEEQSNTNDSVCITISPAQFRSLFSPSSNAISFARFILLFVFKHIHSSRIVILIADEIQKYNIAVFEHKNETRALERAISLGQKISNIFTEALHQLSSHDSRQIKILCWKDIVSSSNYNIRVEDIRQYIKNNESQYVPLIDKVTEEYARARNSHKHLKTEEVTLLRNYVIHELPALLHGIEHDGHTSKLLFTYDLLNISNDRRSLTPTQLTSNQEFIQMDLTTINKDIRSIIEHIQRWIKSSNTNRDLYPIVGVIEALRETQPSSTSTTIHQS